MYRYKTFYYDRPVMPQDFVGRWDMVNEIVIDLCCSLPSSWAVIGGRRFGKTSLLKVIESKLLEKVAACEPGGLRVFPLFVDLKGCDKGTESMVYAGILRNLYAILHEQDWAKIGLKSTELYNFRQGRQEKASVYQIQDVLKDLEQHFESEDMPLRLVLLLDEVESATDFPWSGTFFDQLRALIHTGPLANFMKLVLTGAAKVIGVKQNGSMLLNAVKIEHLIALTEEDIRELIARGHDDVSDKVIEEIVAQSGGHPFIAQYLLHHLSKYRLSKATVQSVIRVARRMRLRRTNDFQVWWDALGDSGQQAYAVLAAEQDWMDESTLRGLVQDAEQLLDHGLAALCYHGLVIQDEFELRYRITGKLFCAWFMFNMRQKVSKFSKQSEVRMSELPPIIRVFVERVEQHIGAQTNIDGTISGDMLTGLFQRAVSVADSHIQKSYGRVSQSRKVSDQFSNANDAMQVTQCALEKAEHTLEILETQAAGYTSLTIPAHLQVELEDKRKEVARLKADLRSKH